MNRTEITRLCVITVRVPDMKVICDLRSEFPIEAIGMKKPEKNQGFNGKP